MCILLSFMSFMKRTLVIVIGFTAPERGTCFITVQPSNSPEIKHSIQKAVRNYSLTSGDKNIKLIITIGLEMEFISQQVSPGWIHSAIICMCVKQVQDNRRATVRSHLWAAATLRHLNNWSEVEHTEKSDFLQGRNECLSMIVRLLPVNRSLFHRVFIQ